VKKEKTDSRASDHFLEWLLRKTCNLASGLLIIRANIIISINALVISRPISQLLVYGSISHGLDIKNPLLWFQYCFYWSTCWLLPFGKCKQQSPRLWVKTPPSSGENQIKWCSFSGKVLPNTLDEYFEGRSNGLLPSKEENSWAYGDSHYTIKERFSIKNTSSYSDMP